MVLTNAVAAILHGTGVVFRDGFSMRLYSGGSTVWGQSILLGRAEAGFGYLGSDHYLALDLRGTFTFYLFLAI